MPLILVLTTAGLQFGSLMGSTVVVEKLFSWPGLGSLMVDSIFMRDIPVTQGCVLLIILVFLLVNLASYLDLKAEEALRQANRKFYQRFTTMEALAREKGGSLANLPLVEQQGLWKAAKERLLAEGGSP